MHGSLYGLSEEIANIQKYKNYKSTHKSTIFELHTQYFEWKIIWTVGPKCKSRKTEKYKNTKNRIKTQKSKNAKTQTNKKHKNYKKHKKSKNNKYSKNRKKCNFYIFLHIFNLACVFSWCRVHGSI